MPGLLAWCGWWAQDPGKVMDEFASTDFFLALVENLWHTLGHGA
jgi:hypothetical protein